MDDTALQFAQPIWIIAGFVVAAGVVTLFIRFDRRRNADLEKLIHPRFRQRLTEGFSPWLRNLKRSFWIAAIILLFTAIARPQKGYEWHEVKRKGIDILFAVDTSRSMLAEDLTPNRLERARLGILDFVARLEGDRIGLIPFAGSAFALCPLTLDYDAFRESLNALDTDLIPRQGTDLASAINEAERLFDEDGNNHRVLVLLTDGEDLQGEVIQAARDAAKKGMSIYTVGVGSTEGARIPIRDRYGRADFIRNQKGEIVETTLDESTLKKIAEATEALYVPLGRGAKGLDTIYRERLRLVPKSELSQRMERVPLEQFEWPLGGAIVFLLLEFFISDRRKARARKKSPKPKQFARATALAIAIFISLSSIETSAAETPDPRKIYNEGTDLYARGEFTQAAESLRNSLHTQDLALQQKSYYNLGNSLYRTGQKNLESDPNLSKKAWKESIKAYQDALNLDANDDDARFNQELVERKLKKLEEQNQDDEKQDDEKQDDEKQDDEKQDGEQQDGEQQDGEQQDGEQQDGEQQDDEKQDDEKQDDEKQDGEKQDGEKQDGEKQDGGEEKEMSSSEERSQKQEMTPEEALQMLKTLSNDERSVIPIPQQQRTRSRVPKNSTKGKTW